MSSLLMFTDGACLGNPGPGGYAALLRYQGQEKMVKGGDEDTTNNRMEMMAVIAGFEAGTRALSVEVYTDSKYVKDGMERYIHAWKKNGWRLSTGKSVKNQDLWQRLDALVQQHQVSWHWVKGHAGNPENERVDDEARAQAQQRKDNG